MSEFLNLHVKRCIRTVFSGWWGRRAGGYLRVVERSGGEQSIRPRGALTCFCRPRDPCPQLLQVRVVGKLSTQTLCEILLLQHCFKAVKAPRPTSVLTFHRCNSCYFAISGENVFGYAAR